MSTALPPTPARPVDILPAPADDEPSTLDFSLPEVGPELKRLTEENAELTRALGIEREYADNRLKDLRHATTERRELQSEINRLHRVIESQREERAETADRIHEIFHLVWSQALAATKHVDTVFEIDDVRCQSEAHDDCDGFRREGSPTCARCAA